MTGQRIPNQTPRPADDELGQNGRRVRSIDVARLAGVSRSAVSRSFTPGASIAAKTRRKVEEAAAALGYRPNAIARMLITRRSGLIGIVVAELDNPFYARMLDAVSYRLQDAGLVPLLFNCRDAHRVDDVLPRLLACQVEGVIITAATLSSHMAHECQRAGTPVVLLNRYVLDEDASSVACANRQGGALIADHLIDAGCRRIAFVAGIEDTSSSRDREEGFTRRLRERGASLAGRAVGSYSYQAGLDAARALLRSAAQPDGVFCANDVMAIAMIDVAQAEFGLRVPDDLCVAGYDNISPAIWPGYGLTSVDQDVDAMVDGAVQILRSRLAHPDLPPERRFISPELRIRSSTQPARAALSASGAPA